MLTAGFFRIAWTIYLFHHKHNHWQKTLTNLLYNTHNLTVKHDTKYSTKGKFSFLLQ